MYQYPAFVAFKFLVKIAFPDIHNHFKERFLGDNVGMIEINWNDNILDSTLNISILTHNKIALNKVFKLFELDHNHSDSVSDKKCYEFNKLNTIEIFLINWQDKLIYLFTEMDFLVTILGCLLLLGVVIFTIVYVF